MPHDRRGRRRAASVIRQDRAGHAQRGFGSWPTRDEADAREWDWQLRQPILLSDGRGVVSVSPQSGFLHQVTALDTLGIDRPESKCRLQ